VELVKDRRRLIMAFWGAAVLSLVLHFAQPYGRYLLYPFAFLSTWAHELGHGLTALLCGGEFRELVLFPNLGGYARHTATGFIARPLVSAGGLLGPAIVGGMLIVLGSRSERVAKAALGVLAGAVLLSLALWIRPANGDGLIGVGLAAGIGVALVALALKGNAFLKLFVLQLLGIQFCLGSLSDFDYMFTKGFMRDGALRNSDTQNIAESLLLPYWFWGGLIAAASVLILIAAFYVAWIRPALEDDDEPSVDPVAVDDAPQASAGDDAPQASAGDDALDRLGF
jgi:hypothetical protein